MMEPDLEGGLTGQTQRGSRSRARASSPASHARRAPEMREERARAPAASPHRRVARSL